MNSPRYDLAVAYRIYPKVSSHKPPIFADDKLKLASLCAKSFKQSLGNLRIKIWVLLDNCPPIYEDLFKELWSPEDLVLVRFPGVGDAATFKAQVQILMEQQDSETVYLAEDDYFYLAGQMASAVGFLRNNPEIDFVSPYDHPDIYNTELHQIDLLTREHGGKVWRSCMSTTHTFLTRRETLQASKEVFLAEYGKISPDLSKWVALTKCHAFNVFKVFRWLFVCRFWSASIVLAWYFCWRQILFGRRYSLWIPKPSIANHMAAGMEAPDIDWQNEFKKHGI